MKNLAKTAGFFYGFNFADLSLWLSLIKRIKARNLSVWQIFKRMRSFSCSLIIFGFWFDISCLELHIIPKTLGVLVI